MGTRSAGGFPARTTASGALARVFIFAGVYITLLMMAGVAAHIALPTSGGGVGGVTAQALALNGGLSLLAALGAGWFLLAAMDGRPPRALGFALRRCALGEAFGGLLLGGAILAVVVGLMAATGWLAYRSEPGTAGGVITAWISGLLLLLLPAAFEETLFRGYAFQVLVDGFGPVPAVLVSSVVFAGAHVWNPHVAPLALLNIFLAGVLLSAAYLRRRSLWLSTGVHIGWNWAMASIAELPVSGLALLHTPLYGVVERGPDWITGGRFGPEGGLAGTAAFLLGLALLGLVPRLPGAEEPSTALAVGDMALQTTDDAGRGGEGGD